MNVEKTRVLILVKTYPTLSKKYSELVCTAGMKEDGSWVRIYPVPFRFLEYGKRYKKYQWIEVKLMRNSSDPRPESYKIVNVNDIKLLDIIDTKDKWRKRRELVLGKLKIYYSIEELIKKAKNFELSLALFKPKSIDDFIIESTEREWDKELIRKIENNIKQPGLFDSEEEKLAKETFRLVRKLPYKFFYKFQDETGKQCRLMIEDWEIGQLFWNCLENSKNEKEALEKVRQKYMVELTKKDLYFFLGTTKKFHGIAKNPFLIIGLFYPPKTEPMLFDL
ncbi:hypothetical protein SU69_05665 [Thermosipho melanesiensis]|uniref:Uncharacterized protein n=2 Tax=Thermosipho melanesiensis TaxID=46541 RepID=A6LM14_THEM4|nr:hypothetical protein [Thermosipho melanesiensis]ABR30965.1 hypothetical protein Tmel_1110 [Thermosipho melanesiensis BI429]APT74066.1 hypothetical protein BW47_05945 [Thermosipho melanesiensis]OOC36010.1 hypothetical protein SU68_05725 [Thermosipho melanesiensis]OOC38149.1 hypothetical protein SU69_05665 [Thermosipho melanesiensis]OOC38278.1 hypothetical protein SU70_05675 [Thermosipho melanesiensis]